MVKPPQEAMKTKEERTGKDEVLTEEQKKSKAGSAQETGESSKKEQRNSELQTDLEKSNKDNAGMVSGSSGNRSLHQALKHQQLSTKSETQTEKTGNLLSEVSVLLSTPIFLT